MAITRIGRIWFWLFDRQLRISIRRNPHGPLRADETWTRSSRQVVQATGEDILNSMIANEAMTRRDRNFPEM